jgi:hypothetical protein
MNTETTTTENVADVVQGWRLVHERLRSISQRRCLLDSEEARWLREAERLAIWREVAHPSMLAYMEAVLGYGPRTAIERLRVARALGDLPHIEHALSTGDLSYSAARELTRVATPKTEDEWLLATIGKNLREVELAVSGHVPGDLPTDPSKPGSKPRVVVYEVWQETFALLRQARQVLQEECGQSLDDDAFLNALCRRALEPSSGSADKAATQIAATICDACGRGWQDGAGAVVEIDARTIERYECDCEFIGSIDGSTPARAKQKIPRAMRRLVMRRDHGRCTVPGCRSARNLDIHHIVRRTDGGKHDAANLMVCCSAHHRAIHEGKLAIRGSAPDKLIFDHKEAPIVETARRALVGLGFAQTEAQEMLDVASTHVGTTSLAALIREALQHSRPQAS